MNKKWKQLLCMVLSLTLVSGSIVTGNKKDVKAAAKNYVTNGGFETGELSQGYGYTDPNSTTSPTVVSTVANTGQYSARVEKGKHFQFSTDGANGGERLPAGDEYVLSAWVYVEESATITLDSYAYRFGEADGSWNDPVYELVTVTANAKEWTKISCTYATADYQRILQPRFHSDTADFYIDDIAIRVKNQYDLTLNFKQIDGSGHWMFDRSDLPSDFLGYYRLDVYVDGAKQTLWVEFLQNETYIYSGNFSAQPTKDFRIPKDTVLQEYNPNTGEYTNNGKKLYMENTLYVKNTESEWKQETFNAEVSMSFEKVDSDNNFWFPASYPVDFGGYGTYYQTEVFVDGEKQTVWFEFADGYGFVYPNFFTTAPTKSVIIPAGAVLYESKAKGEKITNGRTITVTDDVHVVCTDGTWAAQTPTKIVPTKLRKETENDSWYLYLEDLNLVTGSYYRTTILVDGQERTLAIQKYSDNMTIWDSFFPVIESGTSVPQESIEFPAGATLYPINPDDSGWNKIISGDTYTISQTIKSEKVGDAWVTIDEEKDKTGNPIYYNIDNGLSYHVSSSTGAYMIKKDGEALAATTDLTDVGTYEITRIENNIKYIQQVVLYKKGDTDADGDVGAKDLVILKKIVKGAANYNAAGLYAADLNRSDETDEVDARGLRYQIVNGLKTSKGDNILNGKMPISGFDGPEGEYLKEYKIANDNRSAYEDIKDLGINMVIAEREQIGTDITTAQRQLSEAEDQGIKVYLYNGYINDRNNPDGIYGDESKFDGITAQYDVYSSFAGYYLGDEPAVGTRTSETDENMYIEDLATPIKKVEKYANVFGYLNLLPSHSVSAGDYDAYESYVKQASDTGTEILSYDLYLRANYRIETSGFLGQNKTRVYDIYTEKFYENLRYMNQLAAEEEKPYHAFVQVGTDFVKDNDEATSQSNLTTVQEMYLEANAALAMGAKGLTYYSLIQPTEYSTYTYTEWLQTKTGYDYFRSGLLNANYAINNGAGGANYEYYNAAKKINTYVDKIDEVLMNAEHKAVIVTNDVVAEDYLGQTGENRIRSWKELSNVTGSSEVLVGCFDYYGKSAYLVVNITPDGRGTVSSQTVTLNFDKSRSYTYTTMDATETQGTGSALNLTIAAGESVLVVMD